ncbi:hypothetical protein EVAR_23362_1 [Eumeta japonica]|uniref:C2H2-type domain-containing protein n=1 Tax=Eumeta variegata TaxID=151549 RepID=A0A4C1VXS6_EUMVA|nr:hypothetical protein EVAR_23362_1 [Eumeta japonica]
MYSYLLFRSPSLPSPFRPPDMLPRDSEDVDEEPIKKVALKETHAQDNTIKILKYSNATIFLWGQSMYRCFYCKRHFRDLFHLKKHCATHPWTYMERKTSRHQGLKKADISFLRCKLCAIRCRNLNELMDHLDSHEIHFDNSGHLLIPFRLGSGRFICEFCQEDCELFEKLAIHMHRHYNTFECDLCGAALSSEKGILDHKKRCHRPDEY